jgi:PAS domain S-box-containing protein
MLPEPAAGGGATSFIERVRSADAVRRQRMVALIAWCTGGAAVPVIVQTLLVRDGWLRVTMVLLTLALGLLCLGAGWLARRGQGTAAGLLLTSLLCGGSVVAVALSSEVGAAPFYGVLGVVIALATLEGRGLLAGLGIAVGSAALIGAVAAQRELRAAPAVQLLVNAVVLIALVAVVVYLYARTFSSLLTRVAAEQALSAEVEARYRVIAENTTDLVALIDGAGVISYASPSFLRVLGFEAIGRPASAAFVDEPEAEAFETMVTLARAGQIARGDVRRLRGDQTVGRFECVLSPTRRPGELLCVARDVTAERAMSLELEQARKMEALGRFAGSIAHDFNNLLSVMRTCTTLAAETLDESSPARPELNDVQEAITRASGLTSQLLSFSRRDVVVPCRVEIGPLLQRAAELVRRLVGPNIAVELEVAPDSWPVLSGPSQLDQIVMNLAANARDAMPSGGRLRVTARNVTTDALGDAVLLTFADTGVGMSSEARAHLFEPFFTTKPAGLGTGLGLATVFGVVKALGGVLEVQSAPGHGTEFRIWLPRALEAAVVAAPEPAVVHRTSRGQATVLVVDDDADVRSLMVRLISLEGFQVISAANAEQALIAAMNLSDLPVLVTDVMLPERDGLWLAQRLLDRFASMRVVLVSGFAPDPQATARLIGQGARFVQKPFSPGALVFAIRESLGLTPVPVLGAPARPRAN